MLSAAIVAFAPAYAQNKSCEPVTYPRTGELPKAVNFTSKISSLHWLGFKDDADKYVFAITESAHSGTGGEIWRSDSYGAYNSWQNLTDSLPALFNSSFWDGAYQLHHNPFKPKHVFVQGAGRSNWVSTDYGVRWERVDSPGNTIGFWAQIKLHYVQEDWMLALVRRNECYRSRSAELDKWCTTDLFVTQDFGRNWQNLTDNSQGRIAAFVDFDWGAELYRWGEDHDEIRDKTIFATAYEDARHIKGPLPNWDKNVHYVMSHDFFNTSHDKVVSCGNQFDIIAGQVYLAVPTNCPEGPNGEKKKLSAAESAASTVGMYVSDSQGANFQEACMPIGDLDLGYQMFETPLNGTFIITRHDEESIAAANAPVSTVFSSGGQSSMFTVSLERVFRRGRSVDFTSIDGVPGMYISNHLGLQALTDAAFHYGSDPTDYEKYVQTRVSYNGGAHWELLDKPFQFTNPQCDICSQQAGQGKWGNYTCQLHLHGPSSWAAGEGKLPGLHSHWSAPGIVMAVGSVGEYLSFASDYTCTFLSRDGGATWQDIDTRATVFEFGDSGGILIKAAHQSEHPTNFVEFSMDEGKCWHYIELSEAIDVISISVEPTASSHVFLIYGEACVQDRWHPNCTHTDPGTRPLGKLFSLDINQLLGNEWQSCGVDAYEEWSMPSPDRCLMGRNVTVTRRKQDASCFNGHGWERPQGWDTACNCTLIDTECDFGYQRNWNDTQCLPIPGFNPNVCSRVRDRSYTVSESGLRLLNGDNCTFISNLINDTDGRGHSTQPWRRHMPMWLIVTIILMASIAVTVGLAAYMRSRTSSDPYSSGGRGSLLDPVVGAWDWLRGRFSSARSHSSGRSHPSYMQPLSGEGD